MGKLVSIVIPIVRNDIHIKECLEHINASTYKDIEIIVVDEGLERSAQRNIGIKKSKGEYLLWLDSDMMISPRMIEDCVNKIETIEGCIGLYIPERIVTKGWFGKLRDWERQFYTGTLVDVMRFVRLKDCPLFDETLHGVEDSDWERRIAVKAVCDYSFNHHDKVGLIKYLKKKSYYAQCIPRYKAKNPDDQLVTFWYRCVWIFLERGKWKKFLSAPHMAFAVMCLLFARGICLLTAKKI